jgi:nicotinate-nucleotide adenylyltransferase
MSHQPTVSETPGSRAALALFSETMRIGFFGGSFDPPHRGHIALARLAMDRLSLDRVLFAPVGVQPLKRDRSHVSFDDRVAMTRLAIEHEPGLEISLIDAPRSNGRPNYTMDTLRALRASLAPGDQIFCLMGADSFLSISRWYSAADLLLACDFVVASRPGFDLSRLAAALPASVSVGACDTPPPDGLVLCLRSAGRRESHLYLLPDLEELASASDIRAALEQGADPATVVDSAVAAYIREHGLYHQNAKTNP